MTSDPLNAVERLSISADNLCGDDNAGIDNRLSEQRSKRRKRSSPEALKNQLEESFLSPPTSFGPEWLNKFQQ